MTSAEIRKMQTETAKDSMADLEAVKVTALLEIAFQLARQNEMAHLAVTAAMDASPKACDCGMYPHKGTCASLPPGMGGGLGR